MIMEAEKSQDLPLVRWRPRKADGCNSVWIQRSENWECWCLRAEDQLPGSGRESEFTIPQAFCYRWPLKGLGDAHPYGGGQIFTQSTDSNAKLFLKHPPRHTQKHVFQAIWASLRPVELTHEINHHKQHSTGEDMCLLLPCAWALPV